MLFIKHNLLLDIRQIIQVIYNKRWLDRNKYYYNLTVPTKHWATNYTQLSVKLNLLLQDYEFIETLDKDYFIYLSPFGVYGSYTPPNKVYVNIQREPEEIAKTIIHEIIHLTVESDVIKLKLTHDEKEALIESKY